SNFGTVTSQAVSLLVGSPTELFVNQVFLDTIGSPAGQGGAYWVALINSGFAPQTVSRFIVQSSQAKTQAVERVYGDFLRRPATSAELIKALSSRESSTTLFVNVLSSREYFHSQGGGTINGFLTAFGTDWFGAPFSPAVSRKLAGELKRGVSRSRVV